MGLSQTAKDLIAQGKLYYGDPCHDAAWGSSTDSCRGKYGRHSLAARIFQDHDIPSTGAPVNDWTCGCPLDIIGQDAFSVIKMSLSAMLLSGEYWEVYADENGMARFVKILQGSEETSEYSPLPRINFCTPTFQSTSMADMVIVRSADPPAFRKCGPTIPIVSANTSIIRSMDGNIFGNNLGLKYSWGEVTGKESDSTASTCDHGKFNQYASLIYADYERSQQYKDGINNVFEIDGFEQILFWLVDVDYSGMPADEIRFYSIQYVKSSELPVHLQMVGSLESTSQLVRDFFPPVCDISNDPSSTGTSPNISLVELPESSSCTIQSSHQAGRNRFESNWDSFSVPSFYAYRHLKSRLNFNDAVGWGRIFEIGLNQCIDFASATIFDNTISFMANGIRLDNFMGEKQAVAGSIDVTDFGQPKDNRTWDVPELNWTQLPFNYEEGVVEYLLRAKAPDSASYLQIGEGYDGNWHNPYTNWLFEVVSNRFQGILQSSQYVVGNSKEWLYNPPGYLVGMEEGLYALNDFWAKTSIARPGIHIQSLGRSVDRMLRAINLSVKPVYQVDFPAAVAVATDGAHTTYGGPSILDPYSDLFDNSYCTIETRTTSMELLQESMNGVIIDITMGFLFPDFKSHGTNTKQAFTACGQQCKSVADMIWSYYKKYENEGNRSFLYTCGPPKTQAELPRLGLSIKTPSGPRTVNSITYQYNDKSSFVVNVEAGTVNFSTATAGSRTLKRMKNEEVTGRVMGHSAGAIYKVNVPGIGIITAWNATTFPWDIGDQVQLQIYNQPQEG
jgi:hypothetical protein